MDGLILEVSTRGLHRYYPLNSGSNTVGRALDNDIILSDPTVAEHQLRIIQADDGSLELINLADTNRTRCNRLELKRELIDKLPIELELGRVHARILSRTHPVESARALGGSHGFGQLFAHGGCAFLLGLACLLVGGLEFYYNSYSGFKWNDLFNYLMRETVLSLSGFVLAFAVLERLLVNRWEVKKIISSVCLVYLLLYFTDISADLSSYLMSASWPATVLHFSWYLLIVPVSVFLYLFHVTHLKRARSILLALLIASPIVLPSLLKSGELRDLFVDFSPAARYQSHLSSFNWHLKAKIPVERFIDEAAGLKPGKIAD
jgi:hypothetical protein